MLRGKQEDDTYLPEPMDAETSLIIQLFSNAYRHNPQLYGVFSEAQDPENKLAEYLISVLGHRPLETAVEVGAGAGRHLRLLCSLFGHYVAIEPSLGLSLIIRESLPANTSVIEGRFPDALYNLRVCHVLFAIWADIKVNQFTHEVESIGPKDAFWVMNGHESEFAELWPSAAVSSWEQRASWLDSKGFEKIVVNTSIEFSSLSEAKTVLGALMGRRVQDVINRSSLSQQIVIWHKQQIARNEPL